MSLSTDTISGWMPNTPKAGIPDTNYSTGHVSRRAVCLHIIVGSANSAISKFKNPASQTSAHFVVSKTGQITQVVSIADTAYANGLSWSVTHHCWIDPQGNHLKAPNPSPTWPLLEPPVNPNFTTISIEREGYPDEIPPNAQNDAVIHILRYVASVYSLVYTPVRTLIGHYAISPKVKKNCPGPHVDYAALAAAANAAPQRIVHAGTFGAMARQDYMAAAPASAYFPPGTAIEIDDFAKNSYRHCASGIGFIAEGDLV